jgi:hypothetical protein
VSSIHHIVIDEKYDVFLICFDNRVARTLTVAEDTWMLADKSFLVGWCEPIIQSFSYMFGTRKIYCRMDECDYSHLPVYTDSWEGWSVCSIDCVRSKSPS